MSDRTVPYNGGVPLEDTTQEERVNQIRNRRGNPELHPAPLGIGTEIAERDITSPTVPLSTRQPVVTETEQPTGEVLACGDCGVYYPDSDDDWEFCPQCASELETFDVAGESR